MRTRRVAATALRGFGVCARPLRVHGRHLHTHAHALTGKFVSLLYSSTLTNDREARAFMKMSKRGKLVHKGERTRATVGKNE